MSKEKDIFRFYHLCTKSLRFFLFIVITLHGKQPERETISVIVGECTKKEIAVEKNEHRKSGPLFLNFILNDRKKMEQRSILIDHLSC